jgi:hypothetical protein
MNRRHFITIGTAGLIAVSVTSFHFFFENDPGPSVAGEPRALSLIWDDDAIRSVGLHYLDQTPSESKRNTLLGLVSAGQFKDVSAQQFYLEQKTKEDFERGRIVNVDGWILSVTEARQCALFATQPSVIN